MTNKYFTILFLMLFIQFNAQINSVAIVGEAVGGWPGDSGNPGPTDVWQMQTVDGENWSFSGLIVSTAVSGGGLKFRANNEWTLNWGDTAFPIGIAVQNGSNIPTLAGTYDVSFNSTTGAYSFSGGVPIPTVKMFGSSVIPSSGIEMRALNANDFSLSTNLIAGNVQFEIDGNSLGGNTFPNGTINDPNSSIPVPNNGFYNIYLSIDTGNYSFTLLPTIVNPTITITGSAINSANGIPQMITSNGINYSLSLLQTTAGNFKFNITNNGITTEYGSSSFPTGIATSNGSDIPVTTGNWFVSFNLSSGEYNLSNIIPTISIVGSGADGWPNASADTYQMTTTDGITYTLNGITLTDGEIKFRQNNDWTINWGDSSFPTGIGMQGASNIICYAGTYDVTFNRETGAYNFGIPIISIVGSAAGGWPGDPGNLGPIDIHQLITTDNGSHFSIEGITLTNGFVKFRANNDWTINWGGTSLDEPFVLYGPEIPVISGTYNINFNRINNTLSLSALIKNETFNVYPNPSSNVWNFTSANTIINSIIVTDILGKVVTSSTNNSVDASELNTGIYFAKVNTNDASFTLKVIKN